ncbi:MAG TPA: hypothetical protein VGO11_00075 [Chthoniobacteraceae bacterium]|nr:hypothetical protein [Chthoniobacteraceae bacterium]
MQNPASLRRVGLLLLAGCLVTLLPACITRIDPAGNPLKPVDQPVVGTHVSPPTPR